MIDTYKDPLFIEWHKDVDGNKVSIERLNEEYVIANRKVLLKEIPDEFYRVQISGMTEVVGKDLSQPLPDANHYKVDYRLGIILFHESLEASSITIDRYYAKGSLFLPADRIWTKIDLDKVDETLGDVIATADEALAVYNDLTNYTADAKTEIDSYVTTVSKPDIDSYVATTSKPDIDNYVTTVSKPEIDNYITTVSKPELDNYVSTTLEPQLDTYTGTKETQLDTYTTTKEGELDTHTGLKETQLDTYTGTKESELDAYVTNTSKPDLDSYVELTSKPELDSYLTLTLEPQLDTYTGTKEIQLDNYTTTKEGELDTHTSAKETQLNTYTTARESDLDSHTALKETQLDNYTTAKEGELDTHTGTKETQLDTYTTAKEGELDTHTSAKIDEINLAAEKMPYIGTNNNWYIWDFDTGAYVDTGIGAIGPQGEQGTSLEYNWDGTQLGIKTTEEVAFTYTDLQGQAENETYIGPTAPDETQYAMWIDTSA